MACEKTTNAMQAKSFVVHPYNYNLQYNRLFL